MSPQWTWVDTVLMASYPTACLAVLVAFILAVRDVNR